MEILLDHFTVEKLSALALPCISESPSLVIITLEWYASIFLRILSVVCSYLVIFAALSDFLFLLWLL